MFSYTIEDNTVKIFDDQFDYPIIEQPFDPATGEDFTEATAVEWAEGWIEAATAPVVEEPQVATIEEPTP